MTTNSFLLMWRLHVNQQFSVNVEIVRQPAVLSIFGDCLTTNSFQLMWRLYNEQQFYAYVEIV